MPKLALKPDSSFFRKIAIGAVGTREVCADLSVFGHNVVELERGALDTKLWKEVKRKRVRIPDLLCLRCGVRIESRAKTKSEISMSHSFTDAERSWDFGMIENDWIAFPVCEAVQEKYWSTGQLSTESSYWHERDWVRWQRIGQINYIAVGAFRSIPHMKVSTKGVTEGSETSVIWPTLFSNYQALVEEVAEERITLRQTSESRRRLTRRVPRILQIYVSAGTTVEVNQVLASSVRPLGREELRCSGTLPDSHISRLLSSRERTQRFTGIKLARLRADDQYCEPVRKLYGDSEEDPYIRLEAAAYLGSACQESANDVFASFLSSTDPQIQLESVIALGETATPDAVGLLCDTLDDRRRPYFMRSAAAWCLSRSKTDKATNRLVGAFADVDYNIREEALEGIVSIGGASIPVLLAGLAEVDANIASGCAEALRQHGALPEETLPEIIQLVEQSEWAVWLLGNLPRERVTSLVADLRDSKPQLHFAITLLWSFVESWIARRWELNPGSAFPTNEEAYDV